MAEEGSYYRLNVYGMVQGVGFRPYVLEYCRDNAIKGLVKNTGTSVCIYVCTDKEKTGALIRRLSCIKGNDPKISGARVDEVVSEEISREEYEKNADPAGDFYIERSTKGDERIRLIPPDIGICEKCAAELKDPANRRYRHPFISCVSCGPRFSIMEDLPYDRENTTMKCFPVCTECASEYVLPGRRRHAQTLACNKCGPKLSAYIPGGDGEPVLAAQGDEALKLAIRYIKAGKTAAVKNTGGYHFVFDASRQGASEKLRRYKNRENKPFAVLFSNIDDIRDYCEVSEIEEKLLKSPQRPIVLLKKNHRKELAEGVCDDSTRIGAMLPCDGIQVLLLEEEIPLVMTSANRQGQPLAGEDEEALLFLKEGACDLVLANDRKIISPLDDSIYQVVDIKEKSRVQILRRARGLVPEPVTVGRRLKEDAFAAGGDMKAVFAYARDDKVYLSGHFGDLAEEKSSEKRRRSAEMFEGMLGMKTKSYAADMHPGYVSRNGIIERPVREIQHHHAHLLSVAAEHGLSGKLIGASFDGTGYGGDGTIHGGEFLALDPERDEGYKRTGHLLPVRFVGGDSAAFDAQRSAMCFAYEAVQRGLITDAENPFAGEKYEVVAGALQNDINVHISSSAGRFFDACASLLGICHTNTYEGECPSKLQAGAEEIHQDPISGSLTGLAADIIKDGDMYVADTLKLFSDLIRLKQSGRDIRELAYDLHFALSDVIVRILDLTGRETGSKKVLLGGGCFANTLLLKMVIPALEEKEYEVFINEKVPPGDGGLALGQIYGIREDD